MSVLEQSFLLPTDSLGRVTPGRWDPNNGVFWLERGNASLYWLPNAAHVPSFAALPSIHTPDWKGMRIVLNISTWGGQGTDNLTVILTAAYPPSGTAVQLATFAANALGPWTWTYSPGGSGTNDVLPSFWQLSITQNVLTVAYSLVTHGIK